MKLLLTQIKSNPKNPRLIKDDSFRKLVQSIKEDPEFLEIREVVVNKDYMILGGNMRYRAAKEAGLKEIPVKVVDLSKEKQRRFIIKDNVSGGEWDWDELANDWDTKLLEDWGVLLPVWEDPAENKPDANKDMTEKNHVTCPSCGLEFNP